MRILTLHSNSIEVKPTKQAIKDADPEHEALSAKEALVVFTSVEKIDEKNPKVLENVVKEIVKVYELVKAKQVVIYPYVHLTVNPSSPIFARDMMNKLVELLKEQKIPVLKAPFGWYKEFTISVKGHPLAELSRAIGEKEAHESAKVTPEKKKPVRVGKIILDRRNLPPNDHRILGQELKMFHFADEVGAGLPLFLPNGEILWKQLENYMREMEEARGYRYVRTPHITKGSLYEGTGHLPYYADSMYPPTAIDETPYYLRPMSCPHHHMIFRELVNSYKDLPLRLAEAGTVYRNELSGVTYGLIRVRCFTINDAHIYVTRQQVKEEFLKVLQLLKEVYATVGIKDYWFRLSLPDFEKNPEKYAGDKKEWEFASKIAREAMEEFGQKFVEGTGEAAFYGPKIDVQIKNAQGKEETIATSQIDILVPKRLGLTYVNDKGEKEGIVVIHRGIMGSYERFISYLLEQTAGKLPLWLSPVQVAVVPISEKYVAYSTKVFEALKKHGLRADHYSGSETLEYRVREAQKMKICYTLVVGEKEYKSGKIVAVRPRDGKVKYDVKTQEFIDDALTEIKTKR